MILYWTLLTDNDWELMNEDRWETMLVEPGDEPVPEPIYQQDTSLGMGMIMGLPRDKSLVLTFIWERYLYSKIQKKNELIKINIKNIQTEQTRPNINLSGNIQLSPINIFKTFKFLK